MTDIQDFAERLAREFEERADADEAKADRVDGPDGWAFAKEIRAQALVYRSCARRARELAGEGGRGDRYWLWVCEKTDFIPFASGFSDEEFDYTAEENGCPDCGGPLRKIEVVSADQQQREEGEDV